jgi:beta-glucanase (GH16 family)
VTPTVERSNESEYFPTGYQPILPDFREEKEELARVLCYPEISRSSNAVRFLSFICHKYFEGKIEEIREYNIALEALGRKESTFDPNVDPIVRVTARTVRKRLGKFYANEGQRHALQIILPRGHYIPQFVPSSDRDERDHGASSFSAVEDGLTENPSADNFIAPAESTSTNEEHLVADRFSGQHGHEDIWKIALAIFILSLIFFLGVFVGRRTGGRSGTHARIGAGHDFIEWGEPVWSDEFNGAAGRMPDPSKWASDTGNENGWGNNELETYCAFTSGTSKGCDPRHPNVFLDGEGHLVLRAIKGADGKWTSGRITTKGLKSFQFGRVEARMKLPVGAGLWPAFWMMGAKFPDVKWPFCGAVDLVENVPASAASNGLGPTRVRATLHGPRYSGGNGLWRDFELPNGARIDDWGFHTYGVIWSPGMMQFYVDNPANVFFVRNSSEIPEKSQWVFDQPFFLIMNLAVGGDWPGNPDTTTPNPAEVVVDYVRVYRVPRVQAPSIRWRPIRVEAGLAAASIIGLSARNFTGHIHLSCSTEPASAVCALGTSTVDLSDTLSQNDTLTISTNAFTDHGEIIAGPGKYKLTITATTISGDHSELIAPFEVGKGG